MKKTFLFLVLVVFALIKIPAQTPIGAITYGTVTQPQFIVFDEKLPRSNNSQEILKANLKLNADITYALTQQISDQLDRKHEKYQQYYKGIQVKFGNYNVHYNLDNTIGAINGTYYPINQFKITPTLAENVALSKALASIQAKEYAWQNPQSEQWLRINTKDSNATFYPVGELLVYPITDSLDSTTYQLAYQFNIISSQPFNSEVVLVDAMSGSIINQYTTFSSAFGDACTHYSGTTQINTTLLSNDYILYDNVRNIHTYSLQNLHYNPSAQVNPDFKDPNDFVSPNDWTCAEWDNGLKDNLSLDAHWAVEMTYDYFLQKHNRNSYDGQGSVLDVYVHHQLPDYAAWLGTNLTPVASVFGMAFGDGNGTQYDALVSLDIIAHEFGHGVTQTSSGLLPSNPVNEGLSDIWGAAVEYWVLNDPIVNFIDPNGDKDSWLAGEEVRIGYDAERSLREPKGSLLVTVAEPMADTYNGAYFSGLRGKSGVISHWFYLLSDGSSLTDEINDNNVPFSITGIGIDKAADIIYYAQTVYFTENTNYEDARQLTLQAAKDLYGFCSEEAKTVAQAWDAVGVPVNITSGEIACGSDGVSGIYDNSGGSNLVISTDIFSNENYCNTPVTVVSGASAVFKAGHQIILGAGFKVEANSTFRAYTFDCLGGGNYRTSGSGNNPNENDNNVIAANFKQSTISIYPNPNSGLFSVETDNTNVNSFLEVYDIMGKKIASKVIVTNKTEIDISIKPKGIYLVKVVNGNMVVTQKIVYQ